MKYYILRYVDSLSGGAGGRANGILIRILKKYKDDKGLLEHEKTHVRQWLFTLGVGHALLYKFSKRYKLWAEVQAFKIQLKYYPKAIDKLSLFLSEHYGFNISQEEAKRLLSE